MPTKRKVAGSSAVAPDADPTAALMARVQELEDKVGQLMELRRRRYFAFHQPLDDQESTYPPRFDPPVIVDGDPLPLAPASLRAGYSPDDDALYLKWGKFDHDLILQIAGRYLDLQQPLRILDFACSTGRVLRHFEPERLSPGWRIHGVDTQAVPIEWLRTLWPPAYEVCAINEVVPALPFEDNYFDVIYGISVFTGIKYLWDAWLCELRRCLKPGGLCLQTVHCEEAWSLYARGEADWQLAGVPEYVRQHPEMDVDYLFFNKSTTSNTFYQRSVVEKLFGRYLPVREVLDPPEFSFQHWVVMQKEGPGPDATRKGLAPVAGAHTTAPRSDPAEPDGAHPEGAEPTEKIDIGPDLSDDEKARIGDELRESGRLDEAEARYHEVLAGVPDHRGASLGLGFCARHRGRRLDALDWFRRAAAADPSDAFTMLVTGDELRELGRHDEAQTHYREVLAQLPEHRDAFMGLGFCARQQGDRIAALDWFQRAAAADPADVFIALVNGDQLRELGRLDEAEEYYQGVLARVPEHRDAVLGLGYCARQRGERNAALDWFRRAGRADPADLSIALAIGEELHQLWKLDEAEAQYRNLLVQAPDHPRAWLGLGHCVLRRGEPAGALDCFNRAAAIHPRDRDVSLAIGDALRDCGAFDPATAIVEEVLNADPVFVDAWLGLGRIHRQAGRREAALAAFRRGAECSPNLVRPLMEMAIEERLLGHFQEAKSLLERSVALDPDNVDAVVAAAELLSSSGDYEGALGLFEQAIASPQASIAAYLGASTVLLDTGRMDEALTLLTEAEARLGHSPEIYTKRADLLTGAGNWNEALPVIRQACDLYPRHFWLWRARVEIENRIGDRETAKQLLSSPPTTRTEDLSWVDYLLGQIATESWRLAEAIGHFRQALQKNPYHSGAAWALAQLHLVTLDLRSSRGYLRMHMEIEASGRIARGLSSNQTQSHIGQLLDEYELERSALAEMVALREYPPQDRIGPLRAIAERFPDYTPAAMTLLAAMRQAGRFVHLAPGPTVANAPQIPRRIVQYWDAAEVPPDVRRLMASWRVHNPGYEFSLFDTRAARAFLGGSFPPAVLHAYDRVRGPAQKADVFRLASLLVNGGYYVDADDGCLASVERIVPPGCALILYQEEYGTIANNFIGVAPGHPVMRLALETAVRAINRGDSDFVWLATGPGLLTRAFVQHLLQSDRQGSTGRNRIVVLDRGELHKAVAVHCRLAYKQTVRHWGQAAFQHKTPAGGARLRVVHPS